MLDTFISDKSSISLFEKIAPKRKYTICPGLAIYSAIGRYFGADKIYVSDKGIKEGYVKKYLVH
jgi:exopolyphosphatase/pppGpp-phosphohydrolase